MAASRRRIFLETAAYSHKCNGHHSLNTVSISIPLYIYSFRQGFTQVENIGKNISRLDQDSPPPTAAKGVWESYNPDAISAYYRLRPFSVAARGLKLFSEIVGLRVRRSLQPDIKIRARKFRESLIRLGPFYIKLGQALSTRPDMLPGEYCLELAKLQDRIPPFSTPQAMAFIQAQLGSPASKIFSHISESPVAAASLGQVYRAQLPGGEQVAVKVQRPGLARRIALDALVLRMIARLAQRFTDSRSDLVAILDELVSRMFDEVDYSKEASNAERFAELYAYNSDSKTTTQRTKNIDTGIKVPKIYRELSSKGVLTMEWIDGIKLTNHEALRDNNLDAQSIVDTGVLCSLRQVLEEGYFHADPHPGNLVVTKTGQLAYFDFGMMSDLNKMYRIGLIRTLVHYVNKDARGLARDFELLGFLPPGVNLDDVTDALRETFGDQGTRANMDFQGIMLQLSSVMFRYRFRLPPEFAMIIRALGSLEGTATALDPSFKVVASAYPFIIRRLMSDPDPEMRSILRELLIRPNGSIRWHRMERLVLAIAEESPGTSAEVDDLKPSNLPNVANGSHDEPKTQKSRKVNSLDSRATVSATSDLLDFLFSEDGNLARASVVRDIVTAADKALKGKRTNGSPEQDKENEDSDYDRLALGLRAAAQAMGKAPELWLPLFFRTAIRPQAQAMAASAVKGVSESWKKNKAEGVWILMSRKLKDLSNMK